MHILTALLPVVIKHVRKISQQLFFFLAWVQESAITAGEKFKKEEPQKMLQKNSANIMTLLTSTLHCHVYRSATRK